MELLKKNKENLSFFDREKIAIHQMEIILTQKCNLNCAHCMRGNSTDKEITPDVLDKLFTKFSYIHSLSLGGGEISITPHLIRLLTQKLKEHETIIHRVDFTSNGKVVSNEFLDALTELKDYILSCNNSVSYFNSDEDNMSPLIACFSFDNFHLENLLSQGHSIDEILDNISKYYDRFGENAIECRLSSDVDIINIGKAKTLKTHIPKVKPINPNKYIYPYEIEPNFIFMGGVLTVSCDGEFIPVNIPFAEEKIYSYGNIFFDKFSNIASRMNIQKVKNNIEFDKLNMKNFKMMISPNYRWKKYLKAGGNKKFAYFNYLLKQKAQEKQ